jgi:hypothetical protein
MATYTWDAIYDRLKVDQGGLPEQVDSGHVGHVLDVGWLS